MRIKAGVNKFIIYDKKPSSFLKEIDKLINLF